MHMDTHLWKFADKLFNAYLLVSIEVFEGNRTQGFIRPSLEPVNCAAVDDWRKLTASVSQFLSHWTESKHYV